MLLEIIKSLLARNSKLNQNLNKQLAYKSTKFHNQYLKMSIFKTFKSFFELTFSSLLNFLNISTIQSSHSLSSSTIQDFFQATNIFINYQVVGKYLKTFTITKTSFLNHPSFKRRLKFQELVTQCHVAQWGKRVCTQRIHTLHSTTWQILPNESHMTSQSTRLRQFTTQAPSSHNTDHRNLKFLISSTSSHPTTNSVHY